MTKSKIKINKTITLIVIFISATIIIALSAFIFFKEREKKISKSPQEIILQIPDDIILNLEGIKTTQNNNEETEYIYESHGNGTCSLTGVLDKNALDIQIPTYNSKGEIITKISSSAFSQCTALTSITIPANIKEIDVGSFVDCKNLVVITTSSSNTKFCSIGGVLFSKDKTMLICYPANRVGSYYLLNSNVKKIGAYAFYEAHNLEKLLYEESVKDFTDIEVDVGNQKFQKLPVTCNYASEQS